MTFDMDAAFDQVEDANSRGGICNLGKMLRLLPPDDPRTSVVLKKINEPSPQQTGGGANPWSDAGVRRFFEAGTGKTVSPKLIAEHRRKECVCFRSKAANA